MSWTNCRGCGLPILSCRCDGAGNEPAPRAAPAPAMPPIEESMYLEVPLEYIQAAVATVIGRSHPNHRIDLIEWLGPGEPPSRGARIFLKRQT